MIASIRSLPDRVFITIYAVLLAGALLLATWQLVGREMGTCRSSSVKSDSVAACTAILSRGDEEKLKVLNDALLFRAFAYEELCKLPAALADFRELVRRTPPDKAPTGNIRQLEERIAANTDKPTDAVTWSCILEREPALKVRIEGLKGFVREVPASSHLGEANKRLKALEAELEQAQASLYNKVLLAGVGGTALGGVLLAAFLIQGWPSFAVSAFFGLLAGIMVEPILKQLIVRPIVSITLIAMLIGVGAALAARVIAEVFLDKLLPEMRVAVRDSLVPERWSSTQELAMVGPRDMVKRWFVTVAAATGAVVGSVLGIEAFWTNLGKTLVEPQAIVFAALLVGVSLFLTGPLQAYIFDVGARAEHPTDPSKKIAELFANGIDWRAAGRLALVLLAYLQVYLLTASVGATIKTGDARTVGVMFFAATGPAVVSYYWSAALQRGVTSVREASFEPSLYAGAILGYGAALTPVAIFALDELLSARRGKEGLGDLLFFLGVPIVAIAPALFVGVVTTLIYAVPGAIAIDRHPRAYTMIFIAAAILVAAIIQAVIFTSMQLYMGVSLDHIRYWTFVGGIIGWLVGLWASGFPRLLAH